MNAYAIATQIQGQVEKWTKAYFETHHPDLAAEVYRFCDEGRHSEAAAVLERAKVRYVEQVGRPYWRAIKIDGRIVAEHDFAPRCDFEEWCAEGPIHFQALRPNPVFAEHAERINRLIASGLSWSGQTLEPKSVALNHIDRMVHVVDRDERKRRQKRMGQLFVKYGVTEAGAKL